MASIQVENVTCRRVPIVGDGACLFRALAYSILGSEEYHLNLRESIVSYVAANWTLFGAETQKNQTGDPFANSTEYVNIMSRREAYGSLSEISAAAVIYDRRILVYTQFNNRLYAVGGDTNHSVVRLYLIGEAGNGHFEVLELIESKSPVPQQDCPEMKSDATKKRGRPFKSSQVKETKRKRKISIRNAVAEFKKNNRSETLTQNSKAAKKYALVNSTVHTKAAKRHYDKNPLAHQDVVKKYKKEHPSAQKNAVKKYKNSKALKNFIKSGATSKTKRSLLPTLPEFSCIAARKGIDLSTIKPIALKNPSLKSSEVYRCQYCGARLFEEEKKAKQWCCHSGDLLVNNFPPLDANLYQDEKFLKDARSYNNIFAFSALGSTGGFQKPQSGISFVKVQGRVYHRIFDLSYGASVNNTALYINDECERMKIGEGMKLDKTIIENISEYINANNPMVGLLRCLSTHSSPSAHLIFQETSRRTHGPVLGDSVTAPEISGLVKTGPLANPRSVVVWKVGESKPHTISFLDPLYEPLQYPLIFPHSSQGWHPQLKSVSGGKVSQCNYYRHKLLSDDRFAILRRLSQEYMVDMWCRTEEERLQFFKHNQQKLRIATRKEIVEVTGAEPHLPGKIFLPASFTHGPRYMQVKYLDAMAVVCRLGRPSFFLTVTCNPQWPEITQSLLPGQKSIDRPDICNRVFKLKIAKLVTMITNGTLFGGLVSILSVIEFQKRGLPHTHMAFRVQGGGPVNSVDVDRFVTATIPSSEEAGGKLKQLVLQHMLHGEHRASAPCLDKKCQRCTKKFPKPFNDVTYTDSKGFIHYRRPRGTEETMRSGRVVDNSWVVPYNPAVLLLMECHANIEVATSVKVIKYLYKYLTKGPDHANAYLCNEQEDEIENYVKFRYISASEACWRIFEYDVCTSYPAVITLPIHLPGTECIVFRPGEEQLMNEKCFTKLQIYMDRPQIQELKNLTYQEFFEQYMVDTKRNLSSRVPVIEHQSGRHFITARQIGKCVARISFVSPTPGEVYFLRLLLLNFPASSFESLREVEGTLLPTYQQAAYVRGLLEDQGEFREALLEAAAFKTGKALRQFFFAFLITGAPVSTLWEELRNVLCEDHIQRNIDNYEKAYVQGLKDIDHLLQGHGRTLADFGLPVIPDESTELAREQLRWSPSSSLSYIEMWEPSLTNEQRALYDWVHQSILDETMTSRTAFCDGPAGSGKSVLLNTLAHSLRTKGKIVLCTASTGIAALNLPGGITAHSMFRLPLSTDDGDVSWGVSNNSQRAQLIREATLIILDEAPMLHSNTVMALDNGLRDLMRNTSPFGGKLLLFAGDFRQIPPIVEGGATDDVVSSSIKFSSFWRHIRVFSLTKNQRSKDDPAYSEFILAIGEGRVETSEIENAQVVPLGMVKCVATLKDLLSFVFPADILTYPNVCCQRAVLSGTNANVKEINDVVLSQLEGELIHCYSADSIKTCNNSHLLQQFDTMFLNNVSNPGVPDHDLTLKINAVIVLIRNLSFSDRLVNGTKLIVVKVSRFFIEARLPEACETVLIPRISFIFNIGQKGVEMTRRQFPIKLAYGLTINKAQGQTLSCVGIDLRNDVFSHGQLYVALGRVRASSAIQVLVPPCRIIDQTPHSVNVVFKHLLS